MTTRPPAASIRTEVLVPLRFADGFATVARVLTFDGLVDGREHLAVGQRDRVRAHRRDLDTEPHLHPARSEGVEGVAPARRRYSSPRSTS